MSEATTLPADGRARLLAIGLGLEQDVVDVIGIVTGPTYCHWIDDL